KSMGSKWNIDLSTMPDKANDSRMPAFTVKKMLPEYVWDIVHLEGNPYTFVDVQTLLSGTTVGGHTLFDQQLVLNQRDALNLLLELITDNSIDVGKELACRLHAKVAAEEAPYRS
ncbi:MAG: hypothetical protein P8Y42_18820, partial [Exilibacterium sp.]